MAQRVANPPAMQETRIWSLGQEDLQRVEWLPAPMFLPGPFYGQRSMTGYVHGSQRVGHNRVTNILTFITPLCIWHLVFIHLPINGHLGSLHTLLCIASRLWLCLLYICTQSQDYRSSSVVMAVLLLHFWGTSILFPIGLQQFFPYMFSSYLLHFQ